MIITISGTPGSGKDSVGRIISTELGYELVSVGDIRRMMAADRGMTISEFNKLGETDDSTDIDVDKETERLGKERDNLIVIGRTAFHFIPHSVKVYLKADIEVGAERIMNDKRSGESFSNINSAVESIKARIESDNYRYQKYYKLDINDERKYDIIIDSSKLTINETVCELLDKLKKY
ncbi:cytidylate kinase family protein [Candidatus Woesearchaeota archaeon]|nr:cytidylate kinase family protein [Candidatus Woesearchaeota archaeon]